MNWEQLEGKWDQFKGSVKEKWGKLTDDDLTMVRGRRENLVGRLKERCGLEKEDAEKEAMRPRKVRGIPDRDRASSKANGAPGSPFFHSA
jgi:uncharacterized protein YjbJ (UPF0337 family)